MASQRSFAASDPSSIRETIDEKGAVFVEPDNPSSFATAIKELIANEDKAKKLQLRPLMMSANILGKKESRIFYDN